MNLTLIPIRLNGLRSGCRRWKRSNSACANSIRPSAGGNSGWLGTLPDREEGLLPLSAHLSEAASLEAFWEVEQKRWNGACIGLCYCPMRNP